VVTEVELEDKKEKVDKHLLVLIEEGQREQEANG
jgi:hypothetical protein